MVAAGEPHHSGAGETGVTLCAPHVVHGGELWRLTRDSKVLDVNSSYAYLLWCHDFADTSVVALDGGRVVGFVTGYLRPTSLDTVMVWQVAVDVSQRGRGLAARMLHHLLDRLTPQGVRWLHTTISPDNEASIRLFTGAARDRGAAIERRDLFGVHHFPAEDGPGHEPEDLYVIGPLAAAHPRPGDGDSTIDPPRTEQP
ncbi:MAG: diaminobutyrate acetyltransferase [Actinomycetota bacterium]|nr:diaminobutyrate acetyltransferase [Actinomycetota bacterium]